MFDFVYPPAPLDKLWNACKNGSFGGGRGGVVICCMWRSRAEERVWLIPYIFIIQIP